MGLVDGIPGGFFDFSVPFNVIAFALVRGFFLACLQRFCLFAALNLFLGSSFHTIAVSFLLCPTKRFALTFVWLQTFPVLFD